MLPGQRARIDILSETRKIILKHPGKSKDRLLTIIGVELGLSHAKAREYYYDTVDYEWQTEEEAELKGIDDQLEKDLKLICKPVNPVKKGDRKKPAKVSGNVSDGD